MKHILIYQQNVICLTCFFLIGRSGSVFLIFVYLLVDVASIHGCGLK